MPQPQTLSTARSHYVESAAIAALAAQRARQVRETAGSQAAASTVVAYQALQAFASEQAVADMLAEQGIDAAPEAILNHPTFTAAVDVVEAMIERAVSEHAFDTIVASIVQDAGRAAESVATAIRPDVAHIRYLSPPSCSRCAVLAGRVYRYSEGFKRHPNCDCVMIPTTVAAAPDLIHDPVELFNQGLVSGLSKADAKALRDGADFNKLVNARSSRAGLKESGRVLSRRNRPTPEGIYRLASNREEAVALLKRFGYIL